jgi:hypothetical protein
VAKSGKKWQKAAKGGKKWQKVAKSSKKWQKSGKKRQKAADVSAAKKIHFRPSEVALETFVHTRLNIFLDFSLAAAAAAAAA